MKYFRIRFLLLVYLHGAGSPAPAVGVTAPCATCLLLLGHTHGVRTHPSSARWEPADHMFGWCRCCVWWCVWWLIGVCDGLLLLLSVVLCVFSALLPSVFWLWLEEAWPHLLVLCMSSSIEETQRSSGETFAIVVCGFVSYVWYDMKMILYENISTSYLLSVFSVCVAFFVDIFMSYYRSTLWMSIYLYLRYVSDIFHFSWVKKVYRYICGVWIYLNHFFNGKKCRYW